MSEWLPQNIGTLIKLITKGTTPNKAMGGFSEVGINYIKSESISYDGQIDSSKFAFINEDVHKELKRSQLQKDDILFSMAGAYLGKSAIVQEEHLPANTNQALAIIRLDQSKANPKFINYFFRHPNVIDYVNNLSGQSAQPNINFEEIKSIEVGLPPLPEQKAIASVLSSLDDKIDLLHRQNKTLEAMAETLFRQWFIEEAKEDWEEVQLKELVFVIDNRGKTPPYLEEATDHPIIEVNALTKNGRAIDYSVIRKYVTKETFDTWFRQYLEPLDIVLSTVGSIGSFGMFFGGGGCVAQNIIGLRAQKKISNFFLYQWLVANTDEIKELDIGSVQPSIKVPHLLSLSVKIPMAEKLELFDTQVEAWVRKILANTKQIQTLENLRDTLLPKLMSGEVRVQYQTEEVI